MKELLHLNKYFLKYKWKLLLGIVFVAVSNLFAIFPAQLIRYSFEVVKETLLINQLFKGFQLEASYYDLLVTTLLLFGAVVLIMALLKGFFMFLMRQTIIVMSRQIEYDLKNEIFAQYLRLSYSFYKKQRTGDLMNRISEDVTRVRMYLGPAIMYTINLIVLFVLVIATMVNVNAKLTLYVLLPLPILAVSIYYVSNLINAKSEAMQRQLSKLSNITQETFSGIRVVKAYIRQTAVYQLFNTEAEQYKYNALDVVKVNALFMPLMTMLVGISTIITVFIGGQLAIEGQVSAGNIAEFVIYVNLLTWPVASVGWVTSLVQQAAASQKRINEFLSHQPEIVNSSSAGKEEIKGAIEFKNVSFTYPDSGVKALNDISFSIQPNQSLAIIGRTGSGKSTIANLICRLFEVDSGEILIDGKSIKEVDLYRLRESIGYVPQEVFLFSDTIKNNIAFGYKQGEASQDLVQQAAQNAVIHSNISEFPNSYATKVGERGITLSGGQKQRISIARALIKNPSILLFDDCLSAVDTETEDQILSNLKSIMQNRTSVIISHRISSVMHCDSILVLDNHSIVERGTHKELMAQKGVYCELYNKQLTETEKV